MNYIRNTKLNPLPYIRNQTKPAKQTPLTGRKKKLTSTTEQHQNAGPQCHPKEEKKKHGGERRRKPATKKKIVAFCVLLSCCLKGKTLLQGGEEKEMIKKM